MATTPCYFPGCICITLASRKLSVTHHQQLLQTTTTSLTHFHLRASATNNTRIRRSRRLKSDAEICNDIREFLASVGLPEDHIPSTKELLLHGRNDLANIVRRRGHKQIRELLTSTLNGDINSLNTERGLDENLDAADDHHENLSTGQNVKVDSLVDDVTASTEFLLASNYNSLHAGSNQSSDECTSIPVESSADSSVDGQGELKDHAEVVNNVAEGNFYPTEVTIVDSDGRSSREALYPNFDNQSSMPTETSGELPFEKNSSGNLDGEDDLVGKLVGDITFPSAVPSMDKHSNSSFNESVLDTEDKVLIPLESSRDLPMEQKDQCAFEGLDDSNSNVAEDDPSISEVSIMESLSGENKIGSVHYADNCGINPDFLANLSFEEKVTNFIQNGDLDPVEDHVSGISSGDASQRSKGHSESELELVADMPPSAHPPKDNNTMVLNGSSLDQLCQDDYMQHEDLATDFNKNLDAEAPKVQKQSEINHLKFMLVVIIKFL